MSNAFDTDAVLQALAEALRAEYVHESVGFNAAEAIEDWGPANTFSGGEEFAYSIQALKRGVIVGQTSRGGANMGQIFPLPAGFRAFIPQGEPINPTTGGNWEGVGVKPDVETAPGDELAKARAISAR